MYLSSSSCLSGYMFTLGTTWSDTHIFKSDKVRQLQDFVFLVYKTAFLQHSLPFPFLLLHWRSVFPSCFSFLRLPSASVIMGQSLCRQRVAHWLCHSTALWWKAAGQWRRRGSERTRQMWPPRPRPPVRSATGRLCVWHHPEPACLQSTGHTGWHPQTATRVLKNCQIKGEMG